MIFSLTGCFGGGGSGGSKSGTKNSDGSIPFIDGNKTNEPDKNSTDDGNKTKEPDENTTDDSNETEEPNKNPTSITKTNNGNWIYIEDGTEEKIDKEFAYPIKYLGKNFIEVTKEDNSTHILLRDGSPDGVVRGRLYTDIEFVQKLNKETNEKVTSPEPRFKKPKNGEKYTVIIDDGFNVQHKTVSANGKFSFSGVTTMKESRVIVLKGAISVGDIEEIIADDEEDNGIVIRSNEKNATRIKNDDIIFDDNLSVKHEDTDLGNFPIPDKNTKYNFKVTKTIHEQDKDDRYMYENRTYKGKLTFTNTEKEMATALNYEITTSDPYVEELTHDIVMGSVEAGGSVEIPFEITFGRLDKIAHRVKLDFLIKDVNGKQWLDNVYLDVYQTPINVNLKTKTSNLKGYFITPEHEIISIDTKDIKVRIPNRPDSSYYFLVTSPKDIGAETAYSLGVDVNASEFEDFHDTSAYEPNNLEEKATKLQVGDSIKSFIHKGDIDFYTIDFQKSMSYEPPRLPFN